jgi:hypothetical protein
MAERNEHRCEEASWYECPVCGHRVEHDGSFRSLDDEMPSPLYPQ